MRPESSYASGADQASTSFCDELMLCPARDHELAAWLERECNRNKGTQRVCFVIRSSSYDSVWHNYNSLRMNLGRGLVRGRRAVVQGDLCWHLRRLPTSTAFRHDHHRNSIVIPWRQGGMCREHLFTKAIWHLVPERPFAPPPLGGAWARMARPHPFGRPLVTSCRQWGTSCEVCCSRKY